MYTEKMLLHKHVLHSWLVSLAHQFVSKLWRLAKRTSITTSKLLVLSEKNFVIPSMIKATKFHQLIIPMLSFLDIDMQKAPADADISFFYSTT